MPPLFSCLLLMLLLPTLPQQPGLSSFSNSPALFLLITGIRGAPGPAARPTWCRFHRRQSSSRCQSLRSWFSAPSSPSLPPGYPSLSALQLQLRPKWQRFYRRNSATSSGSYFPQSHLTPELQASQEKGAQPFASLILGPLPWLGIGAHAWGSHKGQTTTAINCCKVRNQLHLTRRILKPSISQVTASIIPGCCKASGQSEKLPCI